jgi:hypothetical protein
VLHLAKHTVNKSQRMSWLRKLGGVRHLNRRVQHLAHSIVETSQCNPNQRSFFRSPGMHGIKSKHPLSVTRLRGIDG